MSLWPLEWKSIQFVNFLLESVGEKVFDGHTTDKEMDINTHINPGHVYLFYVNLKTPSQEIIVDGISHTKQSVSMKEMVKCYSKPSKILGKY